MFSKGYASKGPFPQELCHAYFCGDEHTSVVMLNVFMNIALVFLQKCSNGNDGLY